MDLNDNAWWELEYIKGTPLTTEEIEAIQQGTMSDIDAFIELYTN